MAPYPKLIRRKAPLATRENIAGTSVDPNGPIWPRWTRTPGPREEGDFVSDEPFYEIDEINDSVRFYPPGTPLSGQRNLDGHPERYRRVEELPAGNSWRRRLLVGRSDAGGTGSPTGERPTLPQRPEVPFNPFTGAPQKICLPAHQPFPKTDPNLIVPQSCFRFGEWTFDEPFVYVDPRTGERRFYNSGARQFSGKDRNRNTTPDELEVPGGPYLVRPGPTN